MQRLGLRRSFVQRQHIGQQRVKVKGLPGGFEVAGFDAAEVENVVDDREQMLTRAFNQAEPMALRFGQRCACSMRVRPNMPCSGCAIRGSWWP